MRLSPPVRAAAQRLTLPFLVFVAGVLTVLGKADILVIDRVRSQVADTVAPVLELVARPVAGAASVVQGVENLIGIYQKNAVLREENQRLLQWQEAARQLAAENAALRNLEKLVPESEASYLSAQVIADSGGAFVRNLLVNAGTREGVARGQAAMTGDGLVGRVAEVGDRTARILLLTDLNSHIPVIVEGSNERALLNGDNSDLPRLVFLASHSELKIGDRILTSGSGGVFPPRLPVGTVASIDGALVRVAPAAELSRLQIVRIVDYGLAGMLPQSAVPPPRAPRPGKAKAAADTQH
jgi:rod shape-determining protein MreC